MRAISLFSGVGGFDLGLERAGIETVLQAEQDPHCLKVLARHWPQTERVTDVRDVTHIPSGSRCESRDLARVVIDRWDQHGIDLVYGGFPCQDLSVAGKRAGLGGERSGLWFEFWRVLSELRPRWALIENVPGLLSSNQGRDFGVILDGLDELGFHVAWGILDAQHFGVPQRRRRVFVVAGPTRRSVEQVLSLCESCGGNPEKGRTAGQGVAGSVANGVDVAGWDPRNVTSKTNRSSVEYGAPAPTLHEGGMSIAIRTANTGANDGQAVLAASVSASAGHHGHSSPRGDGSDNLVVAKSIEANTGHSHREDSETYIPAIVGALSNGVRRLTPLECERLMGWPDDWTRWADDGSEISDSHRYRMCGNGVASPVAEWIGWRLQAVAS